MSDPDQHVCEVQLVHDGMLTARKHCNAHAAYSKFRSALELLETFGLMQTPPHTDEAQPDVDTLANEFVQEIGSEYDAFLDRYHQMLGIPPTDDTLSLGNYSSSHERASHDTVTGTAADLEVEVRQLQNENDSQQKQITAQQKQITAQQRENTSQQKQINDQQQQITDQQRQITDQQRQIEWILLKLRRAGGAPRGGAGGHHDGTEPFPPLTGHHVRSRRPGVEEIEQSSSN